MVYVFRIYLLLNIFFRLIMLSVRTLLFKFKFPVFKSIIWEFHWEDSYHTVCQDQIKYHHLQLLLRLILWCSHRKYQYLLREFLFHYQRIFYKIPLVVISSWILPFSHTDWVFYLSWYLTKKGPVKGPIKSFSGPLSINSTPYSLQIFRLN